MFHWVFPASSNFTEARTGAKYKNSFSSAGLFKALVYPEQIAEFVKLDVMKYDADNKNIRLQMLLQFLLPYHIITYNLDFHSCIGTTCYVWKPKKAKAGEFAAYRVLSTYVCCCMYNVVCMYVYLFYFVTVQRIHWYWYIMCSYNLVSKTIVTGCPNLKNIINYLTFNFSFFKY